MKSTLDTNCADAVIVLPRPGAPTMPSYPASELAETPHAFDRQIAFT